MFTLTDATASTAAPFCGPLSGQFEFSRRGRHSGESKNLLAAPGGDQGEATGLRGAPPPP